MNTYIKSACLYAVTITACSVLLAHTAGADIIINPYPNMAAQETARAPVASEPEQEATQPQKTVEATAPQTQPPADPISFSVLPLPTPGKTQAGTPKNAAPVFYPAEEGKGYAPVDITKRAAPPPSYTNFRAQRPVKAPQPLASSMLKQKELKQKEMPAPADIEPASGEISAVPVEPAMLNRLEPTAGAAPGKDTRGLASSIEKYNLIAVRTPQQPRTSRPATPPPPLWQAAAGEDLLTVLSRWAAASDTRLVWHAAQGFKVPASTNNAHNGFAEAVKALLESYAGQNERPVADLYIDPATRGRTLVIKTIS